MKKHLLVIAIILMLCSCRRLFLPETTYVFFEGYVFELGTAIPVQNAKVFFDGISDDGYSSQIDSVITNEEGYFSVNGTFSIELNYSFTANKEDYFKYQPVSRTYKENTPINLYLSKPTQLTLRVVNKNKEFIGIRIMHEDLQPDPYTISNTSNQYGWYGDNLDTIVSLTMASNQPVYFNYVLYKTVNSFGGSIKSIPNLNCERDSSSFYLLEF